MNTIPALLIMMLFIWPYSTSPSLHSGNEKTYCGYALSETEYDDFRKRADESGKVYEGDTLWNIYDQLNDSIRNVLPDGLEVEIFMSVLNDKEVGIDVFIPENKIHFEKIGCVVMNGKFTGKMPPQRYLCIFSFEDLENPLKVAIKKVQ